MRTTNWYVFRQNNSGGFWSGPQAVVVEARSGEEANCRAEAEGSVYFDGVANGVDCECCGSRWYRHNADCVEPNGWDVFATLAEALDESWTDDVLTLPLTVELDCSYSSSENGND